MKTRDKTNKQNSEEEVGKTKTIQTLKQSMKMYMCVYFFNLRDKYSRSILEIRAGCYKKIKKKRKRK